MNFLRKIRTEHLVTIASIAILVTGALLFGERPSPPTQVEEEARAGETRSAGRSGTLALSRLLKSLGARVAPYERRLDLLSDEEAVVISVAASEPLDSTEIDGLVTWMDKGGIFLWMLPAEGVEEHNRLLKRLGLQWSLEPNASTNTVVDVSASDEQESLRLTVRTQARLHHTNDPARPLASDPHGWLVAEVPFGLGRAIVFAEAHAARNDALLEADHAVLLTHVALGFPRGHRIVFDEYHHGYTEGQDALTFVMTTPAGVVLVHFALCAVLVVLGSGRRLGPPRIVHEERRRRPAEFLQAFSRLCQKSKASGLAVGLVLTSVLENLQRRFGSSDPATVERAATRRGLNAQHVRQTLEGARLAARARPDQIDVVRIVNELERLRRKLLA